jgi:hypothetical protein
LISSLLSSPFRHRQTTVRSAAVQAAAMSGPYVC